MRPWSPAVKKLQTGGDSIMVCDVFTWHELDPLIRLNNSLTPFIDQCILTCNRARVHQNWFEDHLEECRSPDTSPNELLLQVQEGSIRTLDSAFTNIKELVTVITKIRLHSFPVGPG